MRVTVYVKVTSTKKVTVLRASVKAQFLLLLLLLLLLIIVLLYYAILYYQILVHKSWPDEYRDSQFCSVVITVWLKDSWLLFFFQAAAVEAFRECSPLLHSHIQTDLLYLANVVKIDYRLKNILKKEWKQKKRTLKTFSLFLKKTFLFMLVTYNALLFTPPNNLCYAFSGNDITSYAPGSSPRQALTHHLVLSSFHSFMLNLFWVQRNPSTSCFLYISVTVLLLSLDENTTWKLVEADVPHGLIYG